MIVSIYVFESRAGLSARFYPPLETEHMSEQEIMTGQVHLLEQKIRSFPEQW